MDLSDLPDELRDERGPGALQKRERLDEIGLAVATKRDEAVKARRESGIEDVWQACEEAYLCIDALNRHEFANARWAKPTTMSGPVVARDGGSAPADGRSTVFVRLTARYVDMGSAKVCETLLPIDDRAFSLGPTVVPELVNKESDPTPLAAPPQGMGMPAMPGMAGMPGMPPGAGAAMPPGMPPGMPPQPGMAPQGMPPGMPPGMPGAMPPGAPAPTVGDLAKAVQDKAQAASDKAEQRIYDWMMEAAYPAQMRKVVQDSARIGAGVLKSPFPKTRESMALSKTAEGVKITMQRTVSPALEWVDPWNLFPHPACGENIHDGDHVFERDFLSAKTLKAMKDERDSMGQPLYLPEQIDRVLKEGPGKINEEGRNPNDPKNKSRFDVWYFYGTLSGEEMRATGAVGAEELPDELTEAYCIVTLVNDSVIRVTTNPLDSGRFPFNVMPWSRRAGSWAGVGVAEQVAMPQKMVNAATRAVLNNAGVSAGVQIIMDVLGVVPADGHKTLTPNKLWYKTAESTVDDVRKVFHAIEFPNMTAQLMPIIQYAFKLAEEASNIPLVSQGQQGPNQPDTFGATELQNNNANTLLRSIAYSVDDNVTEPVVKGLYEWLLLDPGVPDEEKGDFQINAKGSIAMVEKAIQEQTLVQMGAMVVNPAFGADPAKWFEEVLKAKRMDPRKILMSEEEKAKRAQMPPPEAPQVTAAKIRAEADGKTAQGQAQVTMQIADKSNQTRLQAAQITSQATVEKMRVDTDRDRQYIMAETQRTTNEHQARMTELQLKRDLAMLDYANRRALTLEQVKSDLAREAMKITATKELAAMEVSADRLPKPPIEPPGRAEPGKSYTQ